MHCTASPASEPSLTHFTLHRSLLIADWLPSFLGAVVSLLVTFSPERSLADCTHYLGGCLARGLLFSFLLVVNFAVQCCTTQMSPSRFRGCRIIVPLVLGHPEFPQILTDDISPPSPRATSRAIFGILWLGMRAKWPSLSRIGVLDPFKKTPQKARFLSPLVHPHHTRYLQQHAVDPAYHVC